MRNQRGFTVVELVIVLTLGVIMTSMTVKGVGMVAHRTAIREASGVFQSMVARTRAQAIESGMPTMLIADAQGDSVMILANGGVVENVRFAEEMGVDIRTAERLTRICMNPRGFANPDCNSFSSQIEMAFVRGPRERVVKILPLGQIRW
jgi:prepilin-type N-terminal cleavage/methylation domain-containing protein